jgi:hypothetical protein
MYKEGMWTAHAGPARLLTHLARVPSARCTFALVWERVPGKGGRRRLHQSTSARCSGRSLPSCLQAVPQFPHLSDVRTWCVLIPRTQERLWAQPREQRALNKCRQLKETVGAVGKRVFTWLCDHGQYTCSPLAPPLPEPQFPHRFNGGLWRGAVRANKMSQ